MRTVRSKTLANAMDQKTRSNRALGKQNREQLSEESRFHKSREIAENLMATTVWKQAKQVLLYASYGSEVSTGLLIDAALAAGKEVFLPKVLGDQMEFFRITDRACTRLPAYFGAARTDKALFAGCFDSDAFDRSRTCL